jgi:putative ABC transport system permease protein
MEANSGSSVIVLGNEIAKSLFEGAEPIGKNVRLYGKRFTVIGVLKKRRSWFIWDSNDTTAYIPVNFVRQLYGDNNDSLTNAIIIKPEKGVDMDAFKSELSQN